MVVMDTDIESLLADAERYSKASGKKLSTIGRYAADDGKFFGRLANGGTCTLAKYKQVQAWLAEKLATHPNQGGRQ